MKKWTKTAGLLFMAAASVYSDRAIAAKPAKSASSNSGAGLTDVKLLDETDPFASTTPPSTEPSTSASDVSKSAPLAAAPSVNPDGTFSLNITAGADIVEQLRVIGFQAQMSIIPSREVHGALPAMDLYNVTTHEALDAVLHTNGYAWREKGKFIYVYSAKEIADMEKANRVTNTEVFRLFYTPAANAVTMLKPVLSADSQVSFTTAPTVGLATGTTDVGGDSHAAEDMIVITDYPENLDRVRMVLKEIDRRPQQILIEATILSAKLKDNNALGVDFNVVGGVDFTQITHAGGQFNSAELGASPAGRTAGDTQSSIGSGANNFSNIPGKPWKVGVVTDNISVFLSALEGVTDTTVLANPKVLALNKQKGEVIVGNETGYITTTFTETGSTQTVEFLKTGTRLVFRPYIADDGYIRMEIHPEDSSGGLQTAANLPFKTTTEVTSNVMVKDGRTVVIGGLFRDDASRTRSQVPGLGNVPVAGLLFRQQADAQTRDEVIILLTPHIIKDDDAYANLSEQELKDAEKLRVGVRKGMMWWGRERLAEMNYEWAVNEMNKPKPDRRKAIWFLDSATSLNPKFLEAINLKQELTGKEVTESDNSSIRGFVKRSILLDQASPAVPTTAPSAADTEPSYEKRDVAPPATNPVASAAPTTQPEESNALASGAVSDADVPATQPTKETVALPSEPAVTVLDTTTTATTQPTTQSVAEAITTETSARSAPSTQPSTSEENGKPVTEFTVTELPPEELPEGSPAEVSPAAAAPGASPAVNAPGK